MLTFFLCFFFIIIIFSLSLSLACLLPQNTNPPHHCDQTKAYFFSPSLSLSLVFFPNEFDSDETDESDLMKPRSLIWFGKSDEFDLIWRHRQVPVIRFWSCGQACTRCRLNDSDLSLSLRVARVLDFGSKKKKKKKKKRRREEEEEELEDRKMKRRKWSGGSCWKKKMKR